MKLFNKKKKTQHKFFSTQIRKEFLLIGVLTTILILALLIRVGLVKNQTQVLGNKVQTTNPPTPTPVASYKPSQKATAVPIVPTQPQIQGTQTTAPIQNPVQPTTYTYTPKNYYSCTLCYHYSFGDSCSTYNYLYETKTECDSEQAEIDASYTIYEYTTPSPTTEPDYSQQNSQCKLSVEQWWTNVGSQYSAGTREAVRQIEYPNYQAKLAECDSLWPI